MPTQRGIHWAKKIIGGPAEIFGRPTVRDAANLAAEIEAAFPRTIDRPHPPSAAKVSAALAFLEIRRRDRLRYALGWAIVTIALMIWGAWVIHERGLLVINARKLEEERAERLDQLLDRSSSTRREPTP